MFSVATVFSILIMLFLGFCVYSLIRLLRGIIRAEEKRVVASENIPVTYVPAIKLVNFGMIPNKPPVFRDEERDWNQSQNKESTTPNNEAKNEAISS